MSQQDNLTVVREIYEAVGRGDVAAILDRVSDDVDWAAEAASKTAPWYGPRAGQDGVASFFSDLAASIEIGAFTPHSFAVGQDDVHLLVDWTIRSARTGREASMTMPTTGALTRARRRTSAAARTPN
jgi:ketosteroid isomerase-like protein